jgi:hypothetical protein
MKTPTVCGRSFALKRCRSGGKHLSDLYRYLNRCFDPYMSVFMPLAIWQSKKLPEPEIFGSFCQTYPYITVLCYFGIMKVVNLTNADFSQFSLFSHSNLHENMFK